MVAKQDKEGEEKEEERQEVQRNAIELLTSGALVTHGGLFDMQVCVPEDWDDDRVRSFAEIMYPCGTAGGWMIRVENMDGVEGYQTRVSCEKRKGFVHIMLDA